MYPTLSIPQKQTPIIEEFAKRMLQTNLNRMSGGTQPVSYLNYDINEGRLLVAINADHSCDVEIRIFQVKLFGRNCESVIYDRRLAQGKHTLTFDESVFTGFGSNFLSITVNERPWFMQRI